MARYQAILAYDGTEFKGFQRQAGKIEERTVQFTIENALRNIGWNGNSILTAGRTDAGVHAAGQVVAFDLEWKHTDEELLAAMNANLPSDLSIRLLRPVDPRFHPRYAAVSRTYEYRLFVDAVRDPRRERFAWRIWPEVDVERMNQAAAYLPGEHDFRSFGTALYSGGTTVRTIYQAEWRVERETLVFKISGNAFLYHMVRKLVGHMVDIGYGKQEPSGMKVLLLESTPQAVKRMAPAHGLTLLRVEYKH